MPITGVTHTIDVGLVVDSGNAYQDGDVVGGLLDLNALCGAGGGGVIMAVTLLDVDQQDAVFDLYFFDAKPVDSSGDAIADDAAFASALSEASKEHLIGVVSIVAGDYTTLGGDDYVIKGNPPGSDVEIKHGTGQLYAYLVLNGSTPTYTATDHLTLKVTGWVD